MVCMLDARWICCIYILYWVSRIGHSPRPISRRFSSRAQWLEIRSRWIVKSNNGHGWCAGGQPFRLTNDDEDDVVRLVVPFLCRRHYLFDTAAALSAMQRDMGLGP